MSNNKYYRYPKRKTNKVATYTQSELIKTYGLTRSLIEHFFPEPKLKKNFEYPGGPPLKIWTEDQVTSALKNKKLAKILDERKAKARKRQEKKEAERAQVVSYLELFDIERYRQRASEMDRMFILHVGPTNSGKTYDAIQRLKKCKKGAYLGPLRLLALEMYDTLNSQGCACNLLTGEEFVETEDAYITSSTIELCDIYEEYDVCVIDEAQMIVDKFRGDRWTKAIYLVNAKEIHICLAPSALNLIIRIIDSFGAKYSVVNHDRLAPLVYSGYFKSLNKAQNGDAFIVFSRKAVLATAAELQALGFKASVIYGALPPVSRREEVRKFSEHENSVVVATDAIGMGISLPIKRIIFLETEKFDGESKRRLNSEEIKQIAGRAGRYGIYDKGEVLAAYNTSMIQNAMNECETEYSDITIPFPEEAVAANFPLLKLLNEWQELEEVPGYKRTDMSDAIYLLKFMGNKKSSVDRELLYKLITCPIDVKNESLVGYWYICVCAVIDGKIPPAPIFSTDSLEGCELQYKAYDVRHHILRHIGIEDDSIEEKMILCDMINHFLLNNKDNYQKRCKRCGKLLPSSFRFNICDECYYLF